MNPKNVKILVVAFVLAALIAGAVMWFNYQAAHDGHAAADAFDEQKEWDKAIDGYTEIIRRNPKDARAHVGRGCALEWKGQTDLAISNYNEAIRLDPGNSYTYGNRGHAYTAKGELDRAIRDEDMAISDYREAIRLNPGSPQACNDLAWLLATSSVITVRDGKEAVVLAKKACELDAWKHSASVDTLAAALAEAGDFTEAIKYQKQALSMPDVADKYRAEGQQRLNLYEQGKPYRERPK